MTALGNVLGGVVDGMVATCHLCVRNTLSGCGRLGLGAEDLSMGGPIGGGELGLTRGQVRVRSKSRQLATENY